MIIEYRNREKNKLYNKVYQLWYNMVQRCTNPRNPYYKNYGGKGILVCEKWLRLNGFIEDIDKIRGFDLKSFLGGKLSLDKDSFNTKIYSLETCRFVSKEENNKIKPNQQLKFIAISPNGEKEIWYNQSAFSRKYGINQSAVSKSIKNHSKYKGWEFILYDESCNDYPERE